MPTLQQIRNEIDNDPTALGYAALRSQSNAAEALAARMNDPAATGQTLFRTWLDTAEVTAALVAAEVIALAQANRDLLAIVTSTSRIKTGSATLRSTIASIFASGTTSRANLVALASRPAARAEVLWGEGSSVTATDVGNALEL